MQVIQSQCDPWRFIKLCTVYYTCSLPFFFSTVLLLIDKSSSAWSLDCMRLEGLSIVLTLSRCEMESMPVSVTGELTGEVTQANVTVRFTFRADGVRPRQVQRPAYDHQHHWGSHVTCHTSTPASPTFSPGRGRILRGSLSFWSAFLWSRCDVQVRNLPFPNLLRLALRIFVPPFWAPFIALPSLAWRFEPEVLFQQCTLLWKMEWEKIWLSVDLLLLSQCDMSPLLIKLPDEERKKINKCHFHVTMSESDWNGELPPHTHWASSRALELTWFVVPKFSYITHIDLCLRCVCNDERILKTWYTYIRTAAAKCSEHKLHLRPVLEIWSLDFWDMMKRPMFASGTFLAIVLLMFYTVLRERQKCSASYGNSGELPCLGGFVYMLEQSLVLQYYRQSLVSTSSSWLQNWSGAMERTYLYTQ